jgi:hypothetical protein
MRLLLVALAFACASPKEDDPLATSANFVSRETSACISGNPAPEPFDVGQVSAGDAPAGLDTVVAACRSTGGTGCEEAFISKEAARCIAESERFAPGLDAWSIGLDYQVSYHRVVWGVENLLVNRGAGDYSGQSITLDAVTGRVLGHTNWSATP